METFFSRYKNPLVLALVLAAQFVLLAVQVRPRLPGAAADQTGVNALRRGVSAVVAPPEEAVHSSGLGLRGVWSNYIDLVGLKQKNEQLRAENQRLLLEQSALAEQARQGQRLQELLAFRQHYIATTVPAQIIGTGGSDHGRVVYIDKGSDDGLAPDMAVITPDGIVGRIRDVNPSTAQVLEIDDPTSAAGVVLEQTRTRGIVRGNDAGQPEIVNLMPDSRIQPGEMVVTSGGDQVFPRGLPVGTVEKVSPDPDRAPLVDVILKPAANLSRLEEVLVITATGEQPSAQARRDLARGERAAAGVQQAASAKAAAAAQAALEAQRASDVLALRLPSAADVTDPDAPDAAAGQSPGTANEAGAPLHPPSALRADHYSPGDTPAAAEMTPGQRAAPYLQGKIPTVRLSRSSDGEGEPRQPDPGISPAFLAAHNAALAASGRATPARSGSAVVTAPRGAHSATGAPHAGSSAMEAARRVGTPGARPAPAAHSTPSARPVTSAQPQHRQPAQTNVVTDGPLPASPKAAGHSPSTAARHAGPSLVPDDGSRPPAKPHAAGGEPR